MLCVMSFQDWMESDGDWRNPKVEEERIDVPANQKHYWRYRMHLSLEQLMKADSLNDKVRELIKLTWPLALTESRWSTAWRRRDAG